MSTPEQPPGPGLTRKQLREIRRTGATPVVTPGASTEPTSSTGSTPSTEPTRAEPAAPPPALAANESPATPAVHLPRAAEEPVTAPPPRPDGQVDLGVAPLTRRQAREQERIRTASVPVITPMTETAPPVDQAPSMWAPPSPSPAAEQSASPVSSPTVVAERGAEDEDAEAEAEQTDTGSGPVVRPEFGADLLESQKPAAPLLPSFDELIARGSSATGSVATPNALILAPAGAPLTSPVRATGEVLITGSFVLPDGIGSQGHARGTADGKDVDAVLIDGELPAASSPTPIAASAAVSTVKNTGEMIRPPAPEKGGKLMIGLAVTAGVLAAALIGVLIVAFVTGVFS